LMVVTPVFSDIILPVDKSYMVAICCLLRLPVTGISAEGAGG
jgi:hypothetical protein